MKKIFHVIVAIILIVVSKECFGEDLEKIELKQLIINNAKINKKADKTFSRDLKKIEIKKIGIDNSEMNNAMKQRNEDYFKGCPVLFELERWRVDNTLDGQEYWGRRQAWMNGSWESDTGVSFGFSQKDKSYEIAKSSKWTIIYIGPWKQVTLTYPNKTTTEKIIRMIGMQYGDSVRRHYEEMDDLNKNIPEQKLILLEPTSDIIQLCDIKWVSQYGYNAVVDLHVSPWRWFTGKVWVGSGEIIEAKE